MGVPNDKIETTEAVSTKLETSGFVLPPKMLCPSGHVVYREMYRREMLIPFYVCLPCTVVYRYQECFPFTE